MTEMTDKPFRVLLATDDSDAARSAEAWVSRARWRRPCEVDVLCVAGYGITRIGWSMEGDRSAARQAVEKLREAEVIASERIANAVSLRLQEAGLKTRALARHGDIADEIIATMETERPDIVAVGPRGRSRIAQLFLGSVSRQILAAARLPVLVARKPPPDQRALPHSILVLIDGSQAGTWMIDWLSAIGWAQDSEVVLLALLGVPPGVEQDDPELVAQVTASLRDGASATLDELAARLGEHISQVELEAKAGHPVDTALKVAEQRGVDVVVAPQRWGRRGHDPFAEKVARYAKTSVLMIPEPSAWHDC